MERLPELLEQSVREEHSLQDFLDNVLQQERHAREERRVKTALKLSGLSLGKTLEEYDYAFQRGLNKNQLDLLATTEFAKRKENILFLGPPGVGKSHLAQGLGIRAIQNGFSVTFTSADNLIDKLRKDEQNPSRRSHRRKFMSTAVLIIDLWGALHNLTIGEVPPSPTPTAATYSNSSTTATTPAAPSSPANYPSPPGMTTWPTPPSPTPSSTASFTTPTTSTSKATAYAKPKAT